MEIHLVYASIVCVAAWLLTSLPRGSATQKYWIWVATSINFLLPLSAVPDRFWPPRAAWFTSNVAALDARVALPATAIAVVWSIGAAVMAARLVVRIAAGRRDDGAAPSFLRDGVPVRFTASQRVPAVDGILRPRIALPAGLDRVLTADEFDAVLLHELRHAKRRDNLIRLVHEAALCLFWFHPLVWMTGARLALYRELSCDESVMDGRDLVSALAKLAAPDDALLLQASASSFLTARLASLTAPDRRPANAMLAIAFGAILLCGAAGPVAHSAASAACARTHGVHGAVK
jgi:beta-lactamase regulating signal transducer with metallopeptidase domain